MYYLITKVDDYHHTFRGTLADGEFGVDHLCLPAGSYTITVPDSWTSDSIIWFLCGFEGGAPSAGFEFTVLSNGTCYFERMFYDDDETGAGPFTDDDFSDYEEPTGA